MKGLSHCVPGIRIEWCKSRARALRWAEKVELLQEEMCRVLQFLKWQADWWDSRRDTVSYSEGLCAYAARQANIRRCMADHFRHLWVPFISPDSLTDSPASSLPLPDLMMPDMALPELADLL